jgi:hypothetical protein
MGSSSSRGFSITRRIHEEALLRWKQQGHCFSEEDLTYWRKHLWSQATDCDADKLGPKSYYCDDNVILDAVELDWFIRHGYFECDECGRMYLEYERFGFPPNSTCIHCVKEMKQDFVST